MHGVHPSPNAAPATGAATGPKRSRCGWKRNSRYMPGMVSSCDPARYAAMSRMSPPDTLVSVSWFRNNALPAAVVMSPSSTNTTVKPRMNIPS